VGLSGANRRIRRILVLVKKIIGLFVCVLPLAGSGLMMVELAPQTAEAFEKYARAADERMDAQGRAGRLWLDASPERKRLLREGRVLAEPWSGKGTVEVPGGLIQDWVGAIFVPGATLNQVLTLVQNYDNRKNIYKPEIIDSKVLSREGGHFTVYQRSLKKKMTTVVLDTTEDVRYYRPAPDFAYSLSRATRIAEVQNLGKPDERELPPGKDHGYLWRMNSTWRFAERDRGVYLECEVISLTRAVPTGLGWLISPIVRSLPRDSLAKTLEETGDALKR
jgi:hypothetical protein